MSIVGYMLKYTQRVLARRVVHAIIDGDTPPLVGRAKGNQNRNAKRQPLSDARKISTKIENQIAYAQAIVNPVPPKPRAPRPAKVKKPSLWADLVEGFRGAPKLAPQIVSKAVWTDSRNKTAATIVAMPLTHTHGFAMQINGRQNLGRIDGQLSLTDTRRPIPSNDTRDYSATKMV